MFFPSARLAALLPLLASLTGAALLPSAFAPRQAPNTLYQGDPASQTASLNFTSFVFGIKRHDAEKLAGGHKILPAQGLPQGYIKDDEVPVVFLGGFLGWLKLSKSPVTSERSDADMSAYPSLSFPQPVCSMTSAS